MLRVWLHIIKQSCHIVAKRRDTLIRDPAYRHQATSPLELPAKL
jgi:hypothetical protein